MDFYAVESKIKMDEYEEEIYTEDDDEELFKEELILAMVDSCGLSQKQAESIYERAYQESHHSGLSGIAYNAKNMSYFIRSIMNME